MRTLVRVQGKFQVGRNNTYRVSQGTYPLAFSAAPGRRSGAEFHFFTSLHNFLSQNRYVNRCLAFPEIQPEL